MNLQQASAGLVHSSKRGLLTKLPRREEIAGYIWTSPWWIGFLVFSLYPMLQASTTLSPMPGGWGSRPGWGSRITSLL